jgi:hypothetical protein
MALVPDPGWVTCPECGGAARREPGGIRCVAGGHMFLFAAILPMTSVSSDWRNRLRQRALDEGFMSPGRGGQIPIQLLERLEEGLNRRQVGTE